jgi:aminoglycoside/choline kinase family phosphotransferase
MNVDAKIINEWYAAGKLKNYLFDYFNLKLKENWNELISASKEYKKKYYIQIG